jgi:hypothetical protein
VGVVYGTQLLWLKPYPLCVADRGSISGTRIPVENFDFFGPLFCSTFFFVQPHSVQQMEEPALFDDVV